MHVAIFVLRAARRLFIVVQYYVMYRPVRRSARTTQTADDLWATPSGHSLLKTLWGIDEKQATQPLPLAAWMCVETMSTSTPTPPDGYNSDGTWGAWDPTLCADANSYDGKEPWKDEQAGAQSDNGADEGWGKPISETWKVPGKVESGWACGPAQSICAGLSPPGDPSTLK